MRDGLRLNLRQMDLQIEKEKKPNDDQGSAEKTAAFGERGGVQRSQRA